MQRECEVDHEIFLFQAEDPGNDPAGRQRHISLADIVPVLIGQHANEAYDIVIIVERFAGPHADDVRDPFPGHALDSVDLPEHLARSEIPRKPADRRRAERTAHPAADLCGNADRIPVLILHEDALDIVPVPHPVEDFHGPVYFRDLGRDRLRRGEEGFPGKLFPKGFREVRHLGKRHRVLLIDPVIDLTCTELLLAESQNEFRKPGKIHG